MTPDPVGRKVSTSILRVQGLSKTYTRRESWRKRVQIAAVKGVDFDIPLGHTLALIGSSGSGKSTIARCVGRLERPDGGEIWIGGANIAQLGTRELLPFRSQVQMLFQDALTSMNPHFTAEEAIEEPLLIQGKHPAERRSAVEQLMKAVAVSPDWRHRPIAEFSGGQQQRLAIARALSLRPKVLILDEALSGLDLSTQARIANLLLDLQQEYSLTYLLISHDLTFAAGMADEIAVMSTGQIVEQGCPDQILATPAHPETKKLVAAVQAADLTVALSSGASA